MAHPDEEMVRQVNVCENHRPSARCARSSFVQEEQNYSANQGSLLSESFIGATLPRCSGFRGLML